jgi:DNA ligase-1
MTTDDLYDALERCAATASKKEKLAIVQTLGEFKPWLVAALDPRVTYGVSEQTVPAPGFAADRALGLDDFTLLSDLYERRITGDAALQKIYFRTQGLSVKSQEVLRRILLKDLRCGVGATIVNQAFPGLIFDPPYMRCTLPKDSNMDKWDWSVGIIAQLKADGMFVNVDLDADFKLTISSRQGVPFPAGALGDLERSLKHIFESGTRVMGELTVYNGDGLLERQIGNGILNSVAQGGSLPEGHWVRFDAWDQIPITAAKPKGQYDDPYSVRLATLRLQTDLALESVRDVRLIETRVVYSRAEAMAFYKEVLARKLEGIIVKHPDAIWKDGDSKDQVKFKLEVIVDLVIKGFRPGTPGKRTEKTFGAVVCQTADGLLEVGVSGFKRDIEDYIHNHREELLETVMAVKANGVMEPSGEDKIFSLFSPRFAELRLDKVVGDTLQQVKDQFDAAVSA